MSYSDQGKRPFQNKLCKVVPEILYERRRKNEEPPVVVS